MGSGKLEWQSNYPMNDDVNRTCMAWSGDGGSLKVMNTKCDSTDDKPGDVEYYDKTSGDDFDPALLLRSYICEARAIHTITAYDRQVKTKNVDIRISGHILFYYNYKSNFQ